MIKKDSMVQIRKDCKNKGRIGKAFLIDDNKVSVCSLQGESLGEYNVDELYELIPTPKNILDMC